MKNILLFIDSLVSGGAQRQLVGLAVLLKEEGYNTKVITYHDIPFYKEILDNNGVDNEFLAKAQNNWRRIPQVRKAIKRFNPDVVIAYLDTPGIIASLLHIFDRKWNLIVSDRNTTQVLSRREKVKFWLYRFAEVIVPNSNSQKRFIDEHYPGLSRKTHTIINFVDTDHFKPSESPADYGDMLRIIGVGRVSPQKNIKNLMQAAKMAHDAGCRNFTIDWYGNYDNEAYSAECEAMLNELGIRDVFRFHAPDHEIHRRYIDADVLCLPSLYEGFPNVICEAMSCGLPVICSDVCDNPVIVKDGENGLLFNPLDTTDIANKIMALCDMKPEERGAISQRNREKALNMFSKESFVNQYISLIENLDRHSK